MDGSLTNNSSVSKPRERRRTYFINPAFQWKYTILVVLGVFILSMFVSQVLFGVLYQQARGRLLHPPIVTPWQNTTTMILAGLAFASIMAVALGFWTIIITHRICGPIFVMERYLRELAGGRFPRYRPLRKKDEFKALYGTFWDAVEAWRGAKQAELRRWSELLELVRSGAGGQDEEQHHALESLAVQLEAVCKEAADALGEQPAGANSEAQPPEQLVPTDAGAGDGTTA